jgi:hypothetical protein
LAGRKATLNGCGVGATSKGVVYEMTTSRSIFYLSTNGINCHVITISFRAASRFLAGGEDLQARVHSRGARDLVSAGGGQRG